MPSTEARHGLPTPALLSLVGGLVLVVYLAFLVFRPFILEFTVAASVALLLGPVQGRLTRLLGQRPTLAALLVVTLVALLILVPVVSLAAFLGNEAGDFLTWLRPHLRPEELQELWRKAVSHRFPWLEDVARLGGGEVSSLLSSVLSRVAAGTNEFLQRFVAGLGHALLELVLFLLMLLFLLRDGARLRLELRQISPLSGDQEQQVFDHLGRTVKGVLQAMTLVPLAQGVLASIGFWLFGVPSPVLWGVMVALAALVPVLGSPLAWVPAGVYLYVIGRHGPALGLLAYGLVIISGVDHVLKPLLLQGAAQIHPLLGFLATLGGVLAFGPLGLLVGPVIVSLVLSAVRIYRLDILKRPALPA